MTVLMGNYYICISIIIKVKWSILYWIKIWIKIQDTDKKYLYVE